MSERAFYLIPSDPFYLPDEDRRAKFLAFFKEISPLPNANGEYCCSVYDAPHPVTAGEGFEAVICPHCGTRLALFDDEGDTRNADWWEAALALDRDAEVATPCCGGKTRVASFRFYGDGAFARFQVGALEPSESSFWGEDGNLLPATLQRFEEILGCGVLQIWEY